MQIENSAVSFMEVKPMLTPFIICFREGIEIFILIIPLALYFNKNKMYEMSKNIMLGGIVGAASATMIGSIIFSQAALLNGPAGELFDGVLGVILSLLILYSVVLLRKTKSLSAVPNERFISLSKKGIFIISAITFFREFLEAILFILTGSTSAPLLIVGSALFGFICAALSVYIIARGITNFNINIVFYILNLFLVGLGAYYIGDALDVLFSSYIPQAFTIGVLVYAVPSYFIILKNDLKKYLNSGKIK